MTSWSTLDLVQLMMIGGKLNAEYRDTDLTEEEGCIRGEHSRAADLAYLRGMCDLLVALDGGDGDPVMRSAVLATGMEQAATQMFHARKVIDP